MASGTLNYVIFDSNADPDLDLEASCNVVAQVVEAALRQDGQDVTVVPHPNGRFSELEIRGLRTEGYDAWTAVEAIVSELPDEVWIMKEAPADGA